MNSDNPRKNDDEIDLGPFLNGLYHIYKRMMQKLGFAYDAALKNYIPMALFVAAGIGLGVLLYNMADPVYKANMTLQSHVLSNDYYHDRISKLQLIVKDRSYSLLAKQLQIDENTASKVLSIAYSIVYENKKDKDTVVVGIPFKVRIEVKDPAVIDQMQTAILNYLENNEYSLEQKKIRKENLELLHKKLNSEIEQLDSLKGIVATSMLQHSGSTGITIGQPIDPLSVYREQINLFQKNLNLNSELAMIDNIHVIDPFLAREKPDSPKLFKNVVICGFIGFLAGLIYSIRREKKRLSRLNTI